MLTDEFDFGGIARTNFCVALKADERPTFFVPTNGAVKDKLGEMLNHTVAAFNALPEPWEAFDVSEDYGERRRVYRDLADDLMSELRGIFDGDHDQEMANVIDQIA